MLYECDGTQQVAEQILAFIKHFRYYLRLATPSIVFVSLRELNVHSRQTAHRTKKNTKQSFHGERQIKRQKIENTVLSISMIVIICIQ